MNERHLRGALRWIPHDQRNGVICQRKPKVRPASSGLGTACATIQTIDGVGW